MEPSQIAAGFFIYAYLKQLKVTFVHNSLYLKYDVQNLSIIVQIDVEEIIRVSVWKLETTRWFVPATLTLTLILGEFAPNMTFAR